MHTYIFCTLPKFVRGNCQNLGTEEKTLKTSNIRKLMKTFCVISKFVIEMQQACF